jgi:hypothetical protein
MGYNVSFTKAKLQNYIMKPFAMIPQSKKMVVEQDVGNHPSFITEQEQGPPLQDMLRRCRTPEHAQ